MEESKESIIDHHEPFEIELPNASRPYKDTDDGYSDDEQHSNITEDEENVVPLMRGSRGNMTLTEVTKESLACYPIYGLVALLLGVLVAAVVAVPPRQIKITKCMNETTGGISWENYMSNARKLNGTNRCIPGHSSCTCMDYAEPVFPEDNRKDLWWDAFHQNLERIQQFVDSGSPHLDVVMLGDSITEHWLGTELGQPDQVYQDLVPVYQKLFRPENGSDISGLAFGIGGDQCPNLLYRVESGEMNEALQPAVWWVLIGTNDIGYAFCNHEITTSGIILIAETIHKRRPNATVVINSLLPRGTETQLEFWDQLSKINQGLACYADGRDRIDFFNSTPLFLQSDGVTLNSSLLADGLHPNAAGATIWGEAIVRRVKEIVQAKR